jgi:hypothetical protein
MHFWFIHEPPSEFSLSWQIREHCSSAIGPLHASKKKRLNFSQYASISTTCSSAICKGNKLFFELVRIFTKLLNKTFAIWTTIFQCPSHEPKTYKNIKKWQKDIIIVFLSNFFCSNIFSVKKNMEKKKKMKVT